MSPSIGLILTSASILWSTNGEKVG